MDSFIELVKTRRSVRSFSSQKINRKDLKLCVEAARHSPSACNSQPWKFIVIDNTTLIKEISKKAFLGLYSMNEFAQSSAAFIAIISEKIKFPAWIGQKFRSTDFGRIDIGIACEHIVLQAKELGIGSCILGWFDEKNLKKILKVPSDKRIELLIAMGYPENQSENEKNMKPSKETISFNEY